MFFFQRERIQRQKEREAARQAADAADRELHPENWQAEIPAIWNRGDLYEGDFERDKCHAPR